MATKLHLRLPKRLRCLLHPKADLWHVELALRVATRILPGQGVGFFLPALISLPLSAVLGAIARAKLLPPEYLGPAANSYTPSFNNKDVSCQLLESYVHQRQRRVRPEIASRFGPDLGVDLLRTSALDWTTSLLEEPARRIPIAILTHFGDIPLAQLSVSELLDDPKWMKLSTALCINLCAMLDELTATFDHEAWNKTVALKVAQMTAKDIRATVRPGFSKQEQRNLRRLSIQMAPGNLSYDWE